MSSINLRFTNVSFSYESSEHLIINNLTVSFPRGWTGIVGPNGIGKTTLAKLAVGLLLPDKGSILKIRENYSGLYCPQTIENYPDFLDEFFESGDNDSGRLCSILEINRDWKGRWNSLSHGERKRLQIAIMLWKNPDILALDEPTNHLDSFSSKIIMESLFNYDGIGLIISHNRSLLDQLCNQCLFMDINNIILRPDGISYGLRQEEIEEKNRIRIYENTLEKYRKIKSSAVTLKQELHSKEKSLSKRNLDKKDHDAKGKIDLARITGKDAIASRKVKQMDLRAQDAKEELENAYYKKRRIEGFIFQGEKAECNTLLNIKESNICICNRLSILSPDLIIKPDDKICITGNNGVGKSTLIEHIYNSLRIPSDKVIYIPQEMDESKLSKIKKDISFLNRKDLGKLLTVIYRLGSEPERLLIAENPSPGEIKKLMLGLGLLKVPVMIIMDEPTNHMDFPSIQCLEEALLNFNGALLIVSHDHNFIKKLTRIEWNLIYINNTRRIIIK
jgi:ATPase subunit of ABC transporter with duplicated ATPase domains